MKTVKTGYIFLLLLLMVVSCAKDIEESTGMVYGKVTDAETGAVLSGVNVSLSPGGISRTTGSDGSFEFLDLEPGQYQLQAKKADYVDNSRSINVVTGQKATGDITLTPEKKEAKIELSVSTLNFGKTNTSLSFDILNKGNAKFNWNISGLSKVDWLTLAPGSGTLEPGKSCAVQVTLLREHLTENKEVTIIVNADKESVPLKITAEVELKTAKIEIDPSKLDFGTDESVMTFSVKNIGNSGKVSWNIEGLDVDWISSVTPMKGETAQGKSSAVKVTLDRTKVKDHVKTTILINEAGGSLPLEISADEKLSRRIEADPATVILDEKEKMTLNLRSYYGSTSYVLIKGDADWLKLSKANGTIPEYDAANPAMKEAIELTVDREGLQAGDYSCTLIVRSDLPDLEIPVTMKVKESDKKLEVTPTHVDFGQDKNVLTFTVKNVGNTGPFDWNITGLNADCIKLSPTSGTLAMGKEATVTVSLDRTKLTGSIGTSISVNVPNESKQVTISAEVKPQREFTVQPTNLAIGKSESASFTMYSKNGSTEYTLSTKESVSWLSFSKQNGTVNDGGSETITVNVNRGGLAAGSYNCTVVIRTDLGDKEIPVSMEVEKSGGGTTTGTIISCHDDLEFELVSCKMSGTTATVEYKVKNIGSKDFKLVLYGSQAGDKSYIFDDQANQYKIDYNAAKLSLGTSKHYDQVSATIPSNVSVKGSIIIPDVADEAAAFSNITLFVTNQSSLVFKDIAIEGRTGRSLPGTATTGSVVSCSDKLEFTIVDCKRNAANTVTMSYRVKNVTNQVVDFALYGAAAGDKSSIFDDDSNQYNFDYNKAQLQLGIYSHYQSISIKIPQGVSVNGSVKIPDVAEAATELSSVTIYSPKPELPSNLRFNNVKIRK